MVVDDRQLGRMAVVKLARGGSIEEEVFVNEGAGIHGRLAEKGLDVFLEQVVADSASDDPAIGLQGVDVASAHAGRNFERNMDELTKLKIVFWAGGIVVERLNKIL
jgi:hypothetical protein